MGRRRDDPRDQRAKNFPSRRKSKTLKAIEAMERRAVRDAKLFADASASGDLQALPIFLADKRLASAQQIWRDHAPRLDKLHLLSVLDRLAFAGYCIYAAEFVLANKEILDNGYTIMVTTVAGAKSKARAGSQMPRTNPAVDRRDFAFDQMMKLGEKFGFSPLDRHNLIAKHIMRDDDQTLFGRARMPVPPQPEQQAAAPAPSTAEDDDELGIGGLNQFDSPPPGKLQ